MASSVLAVLDINTKGAVQAIWAALLFYNCDIYHCQAWSCVMFLPIAMIYFCF